MPIILYAPLSIIRSSGRFIWPVYYLIIFFSLFACFKLGIKFRYLILILFLQITDLIPGINYINNLFKTVQKLNDPVWEKINLEYDKIKTTKIANTSGIFIQLSNLLIEKKIFKTNISRLGRYNRQEASSLIAKLYRDLIKKNLNNKTIYVIDNLNHLRHQIIYTKTLIIISFIETKYGYYYTKFKN